MVQRLKLKAQWVPGITEFEGKNPLVMFTTDPEEAAQLLIRYPDRIMVLHFYEGFTQPDEEWLTFPEYRSWAELTRDPWVAFHRCPFGGFYMIEADVGNGEI